MPDLFLILVLPLVLLACCAKLGYDWLRLSTTRRTEQRLRRYVARMRR